MEYPEQVNIIASEFRGTVEGERKTNNYDKLSPEQKLETDNFLQKAFGKIIVTTDNDQIVEEAEKREIEKIDKEKEWKKQDHFEHCGIGQKYFDIKWEDFKAITPSLENNLNKIKGFCENINKGKNKTLWLLGNNGTGKTMLSALICKECYGTYRKAYNIFDELKDAENFKNEENRVQVFNRYKNYDLLIIDEIGRFPTDTEKYFLFHILNDRYEDKKPTVIISNLSRKDIVEYLGVALVDRFTENCDSIFFEDSSYRKNIRKIEK